MQPQTAVKTELIKSDENKFNNSRIILKRSMKNLARLMRKRK